MTNLGVKLAFLLGTSIFIIGIYAVVGQETSKVTFRTKSVSSDENFGDCWSNANISCMKSIVLDTFKDMIKENEIKLTNSIVIERIGNTSNQEYENKGESRGFGVEATRVIEDIFDYVKNHALKIDLWGFAKLRIGRSLDSPNNLEIVFDMNKATSKDNEEGIVYFIRQYKHRNDLEQRFPNYESRAIF